MNVFRFPALSVACALLFIFACSHLLGAPPKAGNAPNPAVIHLSSNHSNHLDKAWKRYRNVNLGYCVNYPSRWTRAEAFDGTGLVVETGLQKFSKPIGEIDIGLLAQAAAEDARLKPVSLSNADAADSLLADLRDHIAGLQKFVRAERLETIEQHPMQIQGNSALYVKNRYYDPLERVNWTEEVMFVKRQGELFRLELQCQTDQLTRFEPVFANVVGTLQFDCK